MEGSVPELRTDIDLIPSVHQGERVLLVKDSLGLIREPILLHGEALVFLTLIDGKRNIRDIQLEFIRIKSGVFIESEVIEKFISELDSFFLLNSEHFHRAKEKLISEFSISKVRKAYLSGRSYPEAPNELRAYLDTVLDQEGDPNPALKGREIRVLVAPHIDLEIGKKVYASAYSSLRHSKPERIILMGTGHSVQSSFFSLTEKDFETPLGLVKTDKKCVKKLKEACRDTVAPFDFAHSSEHSLEFQLIFLQHLFGSEFSLVPFLCGSFHQVLKQFSRPSENPEIKDFLEVMSRYLEEFSSNVLVVAGVDFSHIGPKFGHQQPASHLINEAKEHDRILIDALCRGDVEDLWEAVKRVDNKYNVCGFSTLTCLQELFQGSKAFILGYDFWEEEATQSAVSFAAVAYSD
ncbi:AmmeMemoRadiSam system protein B [Acidobacteriota bacterium]